MKGHLAEYTQTVLSGLKEIMALALVLCEAFESVQRKHNLLRGEVQTLAMKVRDRDADVASLRAELEAFKRNRGWVQ